MPERWMEGNSLQDLELAASAWMPFSLGARVCLGQPGWSYQAFLRFSSGTWTYVCQVGEGAEQATDGRHRVEEFQTRDHILSQINGPYL